MPRFSRGFDVKEAHAWLSRRDRRLGTWMKRLGPIGAQPGWAKRFDPVDAAGLFTTGVQSPSAGGSLH